MPLVNEANFFVVFIALLIVFFLLGFLTANLMDRPKKELKDDKKDITKDNTDISQKPTTRQPENQENVDNQRQEPTQNMQNYRDRYYRRYW